MPKGHNRCKYNECISIRQFDALCFYSKIDFFNSIN